MTNTKYTIRFLPNPKSINTPFYVENSPWWYKKMQVEKRRKKLERILKEE
jgi:hypothetical protein